MKFSPTLLFYNIEVYDPLIRNFRVWASEKRVRIFSQAIRMLCGQSDFGNQKSEIGTISESILDFSL